MIAHIYPSVLQALVGRGRTRRLEGELQGYRGGVMQDPGYELRRIPIPRTWVNRGQEKGPGLRRPSPWPNSLAALLFRGFFAASTSCRSRCLAPMKNAGTFIVVPHLRRSAWVSASRKVRRSLITWDFLLS